MSWPTELEPPFRRLKIYTFDPSVSTDVDTAVLNEAVIKLPWDRTLTDGPTGEYLEVIDVDPASGAFYSPVNLNHPHLLAQDGLTPSEGNPQFHQQMVYAVAMMTIKNFERALGRKILWSPQRPTSGGSAQYKAVARLRIYPHALREANAYYSPRKKALLFGYFPASRQNPGRNLPGGAIFTCLSHDIIAHETTHAILDGLHRRFIEPSNPDALAFHEAFADIVALFQHFTLPEALRHQIARVRGDLRRSTLLLDLARQFGEGIGHRGALRNAIDAEEPDPTILQRTFEPHGRGAVLVAAVFDAFLTIYRRRITDLLRIATGDGSIFPDRDLHPDLVERLTIEANKSARHMLHMCIRATDYLPPVDITFGDYLRALITADTDLVPDDTLGYRLAIIEGFRRRGIFPSGCRSLAPDILLWEKLDFGMEVDWLQKLKFEARDSRQEIWDQSESNRWVCWNWLRDIAKPDIPHMNIRKLGIWLGPDAPKTIHRSRDTQLPAVEVHAVRLAGRVGPDGQNVPQVVIEITQRRAAYETPDVQAQQEGLGKLPRDPTLDKEPHFWFRGGCTLIVDWRSKQVRYCVRKDIASSERLEAQRDFLFKSQAQPLAATYFSARHRGEPLAHLHRSS